MTRFGLASGARPETLAGLSGLGDLVLTCSSTSSRNFSLGKGLGEGRPRRRAARRPPHRGRRRVHRAGAGARRRRSCGVDMPIVAAVCALLAGEVSVDEVVERLLARPLKAERVIRAP